MDVGGQLHIPVTLPQGKRPLYKLDRKLDETYSQYRWCIKEKNTLPSLGINPQFLHHLSCSIVTIPTELFQLYTVSDSNSFAQIYHGP
jgi:hypothetical protein